MRLPSRMLAWYPNRASGLPTSRSMREVSVTTALLRLVAILALVVLFGPPARAEVKEVKIAKQYGISYLPLMILEADKLIEKQAKQDGLGDITVTWATFAAGNVMNDAILSGDLHFASGGVGPFTTLWAKTKGSIDVKGVVSMNVMPLYLNSRNPAVKTVKDFSDKDKIALPAVKVSIQAITLQMAAEQAFGPGQQHKLDYLTIGLSHPDAEAALLSGASEVTAHFTSPPYQEQELKDPRIHKVLSSYDVLGGPATFNVVWATARFQKENPKTYAAFVKAYEDVTAAINKDKKWAAQRYLEISKDKKSTPDEILKLLNDPEIEFTTTPKNVMKYVEFMARTGAIKAKPASWKDMFFDNVHNLPGS
jgi:NitT/TauT family transport system substrate-binding protein